MFKALGRKKLKKIHAQSRVFLDQNPEQSQIFSEIFTNELSLLLDQVGLSESNLEARFLPSRIHKMRELVSEKELGTVYKQIARYSFDLQSKYGNNSETEATNFLSGLVLSMMMTKSEVFKNPKSNSADVKIYTIFRNFSVELYKNIHGDN